MGNVYVVDTGNRRIVGLTTAGVASALGITGLPAPSTLGSSLFGVTLGSLRQSLYSGLDQQSHRERERQRLQL